MKNLGEKQYAWQRVLSSREIPLLFALLGLVILFSFSSPYFLTSVNIFNIFRQTSMTAIAAIGMTLLAIVGEVDVSIGSLQAFVGVGLVTVMNSTKSFILGLLAALLLGAFIGFLNGWLVTKVKLNSLVTTLGMYFALRGVVYIYTKQISTPDLWRLPSFKAIGYGSLGSIPWPAILVIFIFFTFLWILRNTSFGRRLYAVGGNPNAAIASGVNVTLMKWICFLISGVLASLSAVILASRLGSGQFDAGTGFEFEVIATVVLGGTSLSGGYGTLWGTIIGVLILGIMSNGMGLCNISTYWQMILTGAIIIFSVALDENTRRRIPR